MSAQQQAHIMETILAIKKAVKRTACDSDSDSSITATTNRGNKIRKRAQFVSQGHLAQTTSPSSYKQLGELGAFQRPIIYRNPLLIDDEGYDLDSDDDEQRAQEVATRANEENPYSSIKLEQILAPLTAVTDLPTHPTLSRPFTSKALTELVAQGRDQMHRENATLWKVKPLLTKLLGDNTWAPCSIMLQPNDFDLISNPGRFLGHAPNRPSTSPKGIAADGKLGQAAQESTGDGTRPADGEGAAGSHSPQEQSSKGAEAMQNAHHTNSEAPNKDEDGADQMDPDAQQTGSQAQPTEDSIRGKTSGINGTEQNTKRSDGARTAADLLQQSSRLQGSGSAPFPAQTVGQGAATGVPPPHAHQPNDEPFIHPLFLAPQSARSDRDMRLPKEEAEELRRLVQMYVQKQEEVCRGTRTLYDGLLKADRLRREVLGWSKAEAHSGPGRDMSDGEDWYDPAEWGLAEADLKKGQDEEDEEAANNAAERAQKKTRNRR